VTSSSDSPNAQPPQLVPIQSQENASPNTSPVKPTPAATPQPPGPGVPPGLMSHKVQTIQLTPQKQQVSSTAQ